MLNVKKKERRLARSFTLLPDTIEMIEQLADQYNTNASRIVETMVTQYGPKILAQHPEHKE